jgi:hypothetical protein
MAAYFVEWLVAGIVIGLIYRPPSATLIGTSKESIPFS